MLISNLPVRAVERFAGRLRFPALFVITAVLFVADLVFPDVIPLIDEVLLGLATVLLGTWKRRREKDDPDRNVESAGHEP